MRIPAVTDEMLDKVIGAARSPVVILWEETDSLGWRHNRRTLESAADRWEQKHIFVSCLIDENPTVARRWGSGLPGISVFIRGRAFGGINDTLGEDQLEEFLQHVESQYFPGPNLRPPHHPDA